MASSCAMSAVSQRHHQEIFTKLDGESEDLVNMGDRATTNVTSQRYSKGNRNLLSNYVSNIVEKEGSWDMTNSVTGPSHSGLQTPKYLNSRQSKRQKKTATYVSQVSPRVKGILDVANSESIETGRLYKAYNMTDAEGEDLMAQTLGAALSPTDKRQKKPKKILT